jgi:hypothetical protein
VWLRLFVEPGSVHELRILNVVDNPNYPSFAVAGWFDHEHLDALAKTALAWTGRAEGCYVTINPVVPDLLSRAANRVKKKQRQLTADADILRRTGLVFDADPVRTAGISATEAEKALARGRIDQLKEELNRRGWPVPILADSGNGYHARYKIDLANNDGAIELVDRVLKAASASFSDGRVKIDTSLSNASRIIKLCGTMSRKGDHTDARPHRWSAVISAPNDLQVVPVELLESFAAEHQITPAQPGTTNARPCGTSKPEARLTPVDDFEQ